LPATRRALGRALLPHHRSGWPRDLLRQAAGLTRPSRDPSRAKIPDPLPMTSKDPLLQPFRLKHLTLRNRLVSTSHEPAYTEDGLPKARYRAYHEEKARGGIGLTMIGGSAVVGR